MIELTETTRLGLVYGSELDNDDLGGDIDINAGPVGLASAVDVRFKLPQFAAASLRQEIGDELVVFADVAWADFSEFETLEIDPSNTLGAVEISTHFKDTIAYGIGADYTLSPEWTLSAGISYASSPVSKGNRLVLLPFDRQVRYGTGVRYEFDETTTLGLSYEYLDLGSGKLTNVSAGETVSGDYDKNHVHFIALTLSKKF